MCLLEKCQSSVRSCTKRTSVWLSPASCSVGGLGHSSVGRQGRTRRGKLASIWNFSGLSFKENKKSWITWESSTEITASWGSNDTARTHPWHLTGYQIRTVTVLWTQDNHFLSVHKNGLVTEYLGSPELLFNREQQETQDFFFRRRKGFFHFSPPSKLLNWWDQAPRHPPYPGTTLPAKALSKGHPLAKSNGTTALRSHLENLLTPLLLWEAHQLCPKLTVNDCVKWNRRSTLESLGSLKMILTLSGSSGCGSGGRHSDFRSFSSCSVCKVKEQEQGACAELTFMLVPCSAAAPGASEDTQAPSKRRPLQSNKTALCRHCSYTTSASWRAQQPLQQSVCSHLSPSLLC